MSRNDKVIIEYDADEKRLVLNTSTSGFSSSKNSKIDKKKTQSEKSRDSMASGRNFNHPTGSIYSEADL